MLIEVRVRTADHNPITAVQKCDDCRSASVRNLPYVEKDGEALLLNLGEWLVKYIEDHPDAQLIVRATK